MTTTPSQKPSTQMIDIGPCTAAAINVNAASLHIDRKYIAAHPWVWTVSLTYPDGSRKSANGQAVQDALDGLEVCVAANYVPTGVLA